MTIPVKKMPFVVKYAPAARGVSLRLSIIAETEIYAICCESTFIVVIVMVAVLGNDLIIAAKRRNVLQEVHRQKVSLI